MLVHNKLGWLRLPLYGVLVFLYLPISVLIFMSFNESDAPFMWTGFSTKWYSVLVNSPNIMEGFKTLNVSGVDAFVHVGTNLPVSALTPDIEAAFGKPLIGVNVATYWLALRRLGIHDPLPGFGILAEKY